MKTILTILLVTYWPLLTQATNSRFIASDNQDMSAPWDQTFINAFNNRFVLITPSKRAPCKKIYGNICAEQTEAFFNPVPVINLNDPLQNENATLTLDTYCNAFNDPPGQQTYIDGDTGEFRFLDPADRPPEGAITKGWQGSFGMLQVLKPDRSGMILTPYACKDGRGDGYGIYFDVKGSNVLPRNCKSFVMIFGGGIYGAKRYI